MDKKILDNMSGQELKELIDDEVVTLEEINNIGLEKIMNFEIDMLCFGTGDMNLIRCCAELIEQRNNDEVLNKAQISSVINKVQAEHVIIEDYPEKSPKAYSVKRVRIFRKIGLVAAIIALLLAGTTLVAAAFGVNIFEYLSNVVRQDEGTEVSVDNYTISHDGKYKKYSTIEELITNEGLEESNIMYPSKWPKGISPQSAQISKSTHGEKCIQIMTNNANTKIVIELMANTHKDNFNNNEVYESHDTTFYILAEEDLYFAFCYKDGNEYSIQANNYDNLIFIIEHLKEN